MDDWQKDFEDIADVFFEASRHMLGYDPWTDTTNPHVRYFDRAGNRIPMVRWSELAEDYHYKVLRKTVVGSWEVSTVWLGLDHNWVPEVPHVYETMVFEVAESNAPTLRTEFGTLPGFTFHEEMGDGEYTSRYSTEGQALAGHEATVREVTKLFLPILL